MPTYTYRCTKCGSTYEVIQAMSDPPLKRCKKCKGALRRTFHPVGIVLKGSGFHRNDYRSKPAKSGSSDSDKKPETGTESKSEAPSGAKPESASKGESKSTSTSDD